MDMPAFASSFIAELWSVLLDLSPWLLVGMFVAGALHVFVPRRFVHAHFGGRKLRDVAKASALGVPLPLCSCGVIPAAIGLKRDGASNGASTGFLISTPQTGVDSILVSAVFLGWPFALFKVVSALAMGMVGGTLVNLTERGAPTTTAPVAGDEPPEPPPMWRRLAGLFRFGFNHLLRDIYLWIGLGVVLAALIGAAVPDDFFAQFAWMQGVVGLAIMVAIAMPLYVCATASVPIAAALVHAGLPAGAALVFLMAGPAVNVATVGAIWKGLGRRVTAIYVSTVVVMSLALGWAFQSLVIVSEKSLVAEDAATAPPVVAVASAAILLGLMGWFAVSDLRRVLARRRAVDRA